MQLEDIYKQKCESPSDINEHLPTLSRYASTCTHVTEMGVRTIVSTYALMHGLHSRTKGTGYYPPKLVSIDIANPDEQGGNLAQAQAAALEAGIYFTFIKASTLEITIDPTEMLFIDTFHIYRQLLDELNRHHSKVYRYIALHDTTTFAEVGEDSGQRGLWPAVIEFLNAHQEWKIAERFENNNGLTILERKNPPKGWPEFNTFVITAEDGVLSSFPSGKDDAAGSEDQDTSLIEEFKAQKDRPQSRHSMRLIPVLGIPVLNRGDLLERLVKSIDMRVRDLIIINNGNDQGVWDAIQKIRAGLNPLVDNVFVYSECKNLGVAASWNEIIRLNDTAPFWFICAVDICYAPGSLMKMYETAMAKRKTHAMIYGDGYGCFCITRIGVEHVGLFDENIYPAYMEDIDHFRRLHLSGLPSSGVDGGFEFTHGDGMLTGSVTVNSNPQYRAANALTHARNAEYYAKKWGGKQGEETFTTPFNAMPILTPTPGLYDPIMPTLMPTPDLYDPIIMWEIDPEFRAEQERIWRETKA